MPLAMIVQRERVLGEGPLQQREDDGDLLALGALRARHGAGLFELDALVHEQRGVAAVIKDHVGAAGVGPAKCPLGAPPVLLQALALPGEDRHSGGLVRCASPPDDHRRRGVVLGGEDVAGRPPDLGAEVDERLDEDGRLHRHVERTGHPRPPQGLCVGELRPGGHEAGHLVLGELNLPSSVVSEGEVGNLELEAHHFSLVVAGVTTRGAGMGVSSGSGAKDGRPAAPSSRRCFSCS